VLSARAARVSLSSSLACARRRDPVRLPASSRRSLLPLSPLAGLLGSVAESLRERVLDEDLVAVVESVEPRGLEVGADAEPHYVERDAGDVVLVAVVRVPLNAESADLHPAAADLALTAVAAGAVVRGSILENRGFLDLNLGYKEEEKEGKKKGRTGEEGRGDGKEEQR